MPRRSGQISVTQQSCEFAAADHDTVTGRLDGLDMAAGMAAIRGGVEASCGTHAVADCPHGPGKLMSGWLRGFLSACVSQISRESADFGLSNVKPGRAGDRARWSAVDREFLVLAHGGMANGAIGYLLGRPPGAIKIKACRLGLSQRRTDQVRP